jgi:RNA 3'-terminal phosphate cyclase (ATP)
MGSMIVIDGSAGEGGGQMLRSALALSMIRGVPFRMEKIRAKRPRTGLLRQHLTAVRAAARVSSAHVTGDEIGSAALTFDPGAIAAGEYHFAIGSAGSTTLVLQTVLPALLHANGPSTLVIEGGTHNPSAPCVDFLQRAFAPFVARAGGRVELTLERHGFFPAGGGRIRARIEPGTFARVECVDTMPVKAIRASAFVAGLPTNIADRELHVVSRALDLSRAQLKRIELDPAEGPGNAVVVDVIRENVTEVFWACGERHLRAEAVAERVLEEVRAYLASEAPIGPHLADQLVLILAIANGGMFTTGAPTQHLRTQLDLIETFAGNRPVLERVGEKKWRVAVEASMVPSTRVARP